MTDQKADQTDTLVDLDQNKAPAEESVPVEEKMPLEKLISASNSSS